LAWLWLAAASGSAQAVTPVGEYEVKAAYLVNFGGFVHWPAAAFANDHSPFVVCIVGDDPFGAAFDPFKPGKVTGRPLLVQSVLTPETTLKGCQILYIAGSERPRLPEILRELKRSAVLTVSDLEGFAVDGGMIQLFTRDKKIRFAINQAAAEAAGLKMDARLLRLAEPPGGATGEERR